MHRSRHNYKTWSLMAEEKSRDWEVGITKEGKNYSREALWNAARQFSTRLALQGG